MLDEIRAQMRSGDRVGALKAYQDHAETLDALGAEASLVHGLLLHMEGRRDEAMALLNSGLGAEPGSSEWASDGALAMIFLGHSAKGAGVLKRLCEEGRAGAVEYGRLGAVLMMLGRLDEAEAAFVEAIEREPGRAEWHSNIGGIRARQYRLDEALEQYERALALDATNQKIRALRDKVLVALGQPEHLVAECRQEVKDHPRSVASLVRLARAHDLAEEPEEAISVFSQALSLLEDGAAEDSDGFSVGGIYLELAGRMIARARYPMALRFLKMAEEKGAEAKFVALGRAEILMLNSRGGQAREVLEALDEADRKTTAVRLAMARALAEEGRYPEAEKDLCELVETYPGNPNIRAALGQTLMWLGRIEEAAEQFEQASKINPAALASLVDIGNIPDEPRALERMERFAGNPFLPDESRGAMAFGLAKTYDKRKDYDAAFRWLREANRRSGKSVRYDPDNHARYVDAVIQAFTPEIFERLQGAAPPSERPVFVCGMPRSGTTLTEQILGSHPAIFPAGELPLMGTIVGKLPRVLQTNQLYPLNVPLFKPRTIDHAARYYLKHLKALDDQARFVVDKMPHNFLHLGFIALLFPHVRIIHVNRDPRDTALSNYQQNFRAKHGMLGYSIDLKWTARHINDYHRLMQHWRRVLPVPIFDLSYEQMVQDQEGTTRKLLDFIGVAWDARVMDFHKTERAVKTASVTQVRQKIYATSQKKWKRYEAHLGELLEHLDPEVTAGYDNPGEDDNPYESRIVHQGKTTRLS